MATKKILDFSNVKEQGNFNPRNVPEGDYIAKVTAVDEGESKQGTEQWIFTFEVEGVRGGKYPYYCGLVENQLWKIRNLFTAAGITVPKKRVGVDPNKLVGKIVGVELVDDEYEGRMKSVITAIFDKSEVGESDFVAEEEDDDEDDVPAPKKKVATKKKAAVVEDDEDEDDEEEEEEAPAPKRRAKKKAAPVEVEDDDDDEEDEDDEDEEPAPPRKKAAAKKAPAKKKRPAPVDDDEDDLEELEIEDL